jgi:hypothetical protein
MTATNLPLTTLVPNGSLDIPAGTAIDQSNGMTIALPATAIPAAPNIDHLFLFVATTNGADKTVTVKAGVGGGATPGPAFRSGLGDLTVTAHAASGGCVIGPLESARFAQTDGSVLLAFQSGIAGTITAFIMPSRW